MIYTSRVSIKNCPPTGCPGVYILQNTMARGDGAGKKMKNEAVRKKMKKRKKGERKNKKRKRGRVIFLLIYERIRQ